MGYLLARDKILWEHYVVVYRYSILSVAIIGLVGLNFVKRIIENDLYQVISVLHRSDKMLTGKIYLNLVTGTISWFWITGHIVPNTLGWALCTGFAAL